MVYYCDAAHGPKDELARLTYKTLTKPEEVKVGDCVPSFNNIIYGDCGQTATDWDIRAACVSWDNRKSQYCMYPQ